jgi:hypothetical protein
MSRQSQSHRPRAKRNRLLSAAALSVVGHLSVAMAVFLTWTAPPASREQPAVEVALVAAPPRTVVAQASPATAPSAPTPPPKRALARPARAPADPPALPASRTPAPGPSADGLTDADFAGAATAGAGSGGGCDMARRVQDALRRDPLVGAAVARTVQGGAAARPIMVWDGDWVQSGGEDGKGLAAVREAITWEVAFSPPACRAEAVRGLVLISPSQAPGSMRLAVGSAAWRWSDLLGRRAAAP